jgi:hypothetical protein
VVPLKARLESWNVMRCGCWRAAPPGDACHPHLRRRPVGRRPPPAPVVMPPAPAANGPEVVEEKQQLHLSGAAAVAALDDLKARIAK